MNVWKTKRIFLNESTLRKAILYGKLIGAVTHVLADDPAMGYGIFIKKMNEF